MMEKKLETTIYIGLCRVYIGVIEITPRMEHQMEKKMEIEGNPLFRF